VQTIDHPQGTGYRMPAWPVRHNGAPPQVKPSPLLGEHTQEVPRSWIGLAEDAAARLEGERVVACAGRPSSGRA
jgi:crotonobetainyl-CoA:carnitine CoA-transferase CaiB-like acyl-CoA transferase